MWEMLQTIYHFIFDPVEGQYVMAIAPAVGAAAITAASYIIGLIFGGGEQEQPTQYPQLGFMPQQPPQQQPFQQMGLPQQPQYGQQPPAITQFPPFQPLFPRKGLGQ